MSFLGERKVRVAGGVRKDVNSNLTSYVLCEKQNNCPEESRIKRSTGKCVKRVSYIILRFPPSILRGEKEVARGSGLGLEVITEQLQHFPSGRGPTLQGP